MKFVHDIAITSPIYLVRSTTDTAGRSDMITDVDQPLSVERGLSSLLSDREYMMLYVF